MSITKNYYLLLIPIAFLIACVPKPDVRFQVPQPVNKNDLKRIPKEFQGYYLSKSDSSILTIDSKTIVQEWHGLSKVSANEVEKEFDTTYTEDIEIELDENWSMSIDIENDSATIKTYGIDTLFVLNDFTKLRIFKGYLFLNYSQSDSTWRVKSLKLENKQLDFDDFIRASQIDSLRDVTPILTKFDTTTNRAVHHDLSPKKKELKEIIKRKKSELKFVKIENLN